MKDIHIHLHHHADSRLENIESKIDVLLAQGAQLLMASQALTDAIARINTVTNDIGAGVSAVAAKVQTLLDTIASGASAAEVAAAAAALSGSGDALTALAANLNAIAADPAQPVPPEAIPEPPVV